MKQVIYHSDRMSFWVVLWDIRAGLANWRIWTRLAWNELTSRYGRTMIGVAWTVISFALFCGAIIFFFGQLSSSTGNEFGPHVVIGFLIYTFVTGAIIDGCNVFIGNENWLKSADVPYGIFVFKGIMGNTFIFLLNGAASGALLLTLFDIQYHPAQWSILPAILLLVVNAVWVYLLLGAICVRYRDVLHLMQSLMRLTLFVTPILWQASDVGIRGQLAFYNPLTHYIEIIRMPMLYGEIPTEGWLIVMALTLVGWVVALVVYTGSRKRITFWL